VVKVRPKQSGRRTKKVEKAPHAIMAHEVKSIRVVRRKMK